MVQEEVNLKKTVMGSEPLKDQEELEINDGDFDLINKMRTLAGLGYNPYEVEHTYNRPSGWESGNTYPLPVKKLFFSYDIESSDNEEEVEVDVDGIEEEEQPLVETSVANRLLDECEKLIEIYRPSKPDREELETVWEEIIPKSNWSPAHFRSFNKLVKILNYDRLSRLSHHGHSSEAILRRVTIDETATRLRKLFTSIHWDVKLCQWLHSIIVDRAPVKFLVCYLEAMQVLYAKIPNLVNLIINLNSPLANKNIGLDIITQIITKKSWDPVAPMLSQHKMPKLPRSPVFIALGTEPLNDLPQNSRTHHWISLLTDLGSVIPITSLQIEIDKNKLKISQYLDELLYTVRFKIHQAKTEFEGRPIILVGINAGSALMCHVALFEQVAGIICIGFSVDTAEGRRGRPKDRLLELKCPVLFVIGQSATTSSLEDMEELRNKLKCVTGLIVVGGADDQMRKTKFDLKKEKVNQDLVDRTVINEIGAFLSKVLTMPNPPPPLAPRNVPEKLGGASETKTKEEKPKKEYKDKDRTAKRNYYQERKRKLTSITNIASPSTVSTSESSPKKQKFQPLMNSKAPQIIMVSSAPTILRTSTINQVSKMRKSTETSPRKLVEEKLPQITIVSTKKNASSTVPLPPVQANDVINTTATISLTKVSNNSDTQETHDTDSISLQTLLRSQTPLTSNNTSTTQAQSGVSVPKTVSVKPLIKVVGKDKPKTLSTKINLSTLPNVKYLIPSGSVQASVKNKKETTGQTSNWTNLLRDLTPAQLLDAPIDIVDDESVSSVKSSPSSTPQTASPSKQSYKIIRINELINSTKRNILQKPDIAPPVTSSNLNITSKFRTISTKPALGNSNMKSLSVKKNPVTFSNPPTIIRNPNTSSTVKYVNSFPKSQTPPAKLSKIVVNSKPKPQTSEVPSRPKSLQQYLASIKK